MAPNLMRLPLRMKWRPSVLHFLKSKEAFAMHCNRLQNIQPPIFVNVVFCLQRTSSGEAGVVVGVGVGVEVWSGGGLTALVYLNLKQGCDVKAVYLFESIFD